MIIDLNMWNQTTVQQKKRSQASFSEVHYFFPELTAGFDCTDFWASRQPLVSIHNSI